MSNDIDKEDERGFTQLYIAAGEGDLNKAKELLGKGANINAEAGNGNTPLHSALLTCPLNKRNEMVGWLIDAGADVNAENNHGFRPLDSAKHNKDTQMVDKLHKHGAKSAPSED